jgi:hypothetical protein
VLALLSVGSDLYVGGAFTEASGVPAANVARWDGSWHSVGTGFGGHLCGFATYGGEVVAVGAFLESDGSPGNLVARWDGNAWQPLGDGLAGGVAAAAVEFDGELWVGGTFTSAGGAPVTGLARWNGSSWDDGGAVIAAGTHGWVNRVETLSTAWNGDLLVGGDLAQVNGVAVNGLASFDGATWTPLGLGLGSEAGVQGITSYHGDLVVFGYLYTPDGSSRIARWNGIEWTGFGSGCYDHYLFGGPGPIAVYDDEVYVGGDIDEAGQKDSEFIARWSDPASTDVAIGAAGEGAVSLAAPRPNPVRGSTTIEYALDRAMTIDLTVYDAAGRVVATLANGSAAAGAHQVSWDSRNRDGDLVAAGLYFVRLTSDGGTVSRKFVVNR